MCRGPQLALWQLDVLRRLLDIDGVELSLVIVDPRSSASQQRSVRQRLARQRSGGSFLWNLFNNGYVGRRARSLQRRDCTDLIGDAPLIHAEPTRRGRYSEVFADSDVDAIRAHDLDFILRFGYGIIRGDILDAATHGVWSFHHGDEEHFRGSPPAFWEIVTGTPVTGVTLQRLTDRLDGGIVLRKGWVRTRMHSYVSNTDAAHVAGVDFPAQVCRDILHGDTAALDASPSSTEAPIFLKPTNLEFVRFAARLARSFVGHQWRHLTTADQWNVGRIQAPPARLLDPSAAPEVEWFTDAQDRNRFVADPFPLPGPDGCHEVLAEEYDYRRRSGRIVRLDFARMRCEPIDLGGDRHASYPYTVVSGDSTLVIPQRSGLEPAAFAYGPGGAIGEPRQLGIDDELLDPTVVWREGRWWLFATKPGVASLTDLYLWWADDLFGPWEPHRKNPVLTDSRSARPGGTPFVHDGHLYRPAQDCSHTYGGALRINRVDELTVDAFRETTVRVLEADPSWPYPVGLHTLSSHGDVTFIDAKRSVINLHETRAELTARLRRLWGAST